MGYPIPTPSCSSEITRAQIHRPEIPNTSSIQSISMVVSILFHLLQRKAPSWYPRCLLIACLSIFPPKVCLVLSMNYIVNTRYFGYHHRKVGHQPIISLHIPKSHFFGCVIIYSIIFFIMCLGRWFFFSTLFRFFAIARSCPVQGGVLDIGHQSGTWHDDD